MKIDVSSFYQNKLVILLENEPLSDKYNQLVLNEEQFKIVSDCIVGLFPKRFDEESNMEVTDFEVEEKEEIYLEDC